MSNSATVERPMGSRLGLLLAVPLSLAVYYALGAAASDLSPAGRTTAALAMLLGTLWMTEALPLAVTSLLPLVLFPLCGVLEFPAAAAPYANALIFVYLGGFILALAIERWNLHRRLALLTLLGVGTQPALLVGGIMLATALLSMWISNTATAAMMLPLGLSLVTLIVEQSREHKMAGISEEAASRFATAMMLGIAYAATIGGLATLIGTPTNLFLAGFAREQGIDIGFRQWMFFAVPLAAIYLLLTWGLLTRVMFRLPRLEVRDSRSKIRDEFAKLGKMSRGEWTVLIVFLSTAGLWLMRDKIVKNEDLLAWWPAIAQLNDGMIALAGAIALFAIPVDTKRGVFAMEWQATQRLPWGVLLLFGGGLSLAEAVKASRLADWIGVQVAEFGGLSPLTLVVAVTAVVIFASEFTSNTATCAAFLPIMYGVSQGIGADPLLLLVATTLAASCAFMLPVGTPPNAIAFGTGYIRQQDMMRAGIWLNLAGVVLIPLAVYTFGRWALGIDT